MSGRVLLLAALAVALLPPEALAQKPQAPRPTYAVGDRWVRNDGVYELIRIEDDHYVFAASADRQVHLTRDLTIARIQNTFCSFPNLAAQPTQKVPTTNTT